MVFEASGVSFACLPKISKLYLFCIVEARLLSEDLIMMPFLVGMICEMEYEGHINSWCSNSFGV